MTTSILEGARESLVYAQRPYLPLLQQKGLWLELYILSEKLLDFFPVDSDECSKHSIHQMLDGQANARNTNPIHNV